MAFFRFDDGQEWSGLSTCHLAALDAAPPAGDESLLQSPPRRVPRPGDKVVLIRDPDERGRLEHLVSVSFTVEETSRNSREHVPRATLRMPDGRMWPNVLLACLSPAGR